MDSAKLVTVLGNIDVTVNVPRSELAEALFKMALEMCGRLSFESSDLAIDSRGHVYTAEINRQLISKNPKVAALIRAAWVLDGHELER